MPRPASERRNALPAATGTTVPTSERASAPDSERTSAATPAAAGGGADWARASTAANASAGMSPHAGHSARRRRDVGPRIGGLCPRGDGPATADRRAACG